MPEIACITSADSTLLQAAGQMEARLRTARDAGFDALLWRGDTMLLDEAEVVPTELIAAANDAGLALLLETDPTRFPLNHPLVAEHPALFAIRRAGARNAPVDPRHPAEASGEARARMAAPEAGHCVAPALEAALTGLAERGVAGFRFAEPRRMGVDPLRALVGRLKAAAPDLFLIVGPPGLPRPDALALAGSGIDALVSSFGWWDLRARWLVEEWSALRHVAPLFAEPNAGQLLADDPAALDRTLLSAAATAQGLILPLDAVIARNDAAARAAALAKEMRALSGEMRLLAGQSGAVTALLRTDASDMRHADAARLVLINRSDAPQPIPGVAPLIEAAGAPFALRDAAAGDAPLSGGAMRVAELARSRPVTLRPSRRVENAVQRPRLVVEQVTPCVEGGDFPVKRVVGEDVTVEAKLFADGHEQLAAELLWRPCDAKKWTALRMEQLPNDGWRAVFRLERMGRHEFRVQGWLDRFGAYRRDFRKKLDAGVAQPVDYAEGRVLVERAQERVSGKLASSLGKWADRLKGDDDAEALLSPDLAALMDAADDRPHLLASDVQLLDAERLQARFSSWYELFPRSATDDAARHGSFADVEKRLPQIRAMGFDTLYFPPIHPIGRTHRKGPNNSLTAGPDDPGSPYAIGSEAGGHTAVHPELGTLDDFVHLVEAAKRHELEIALDFAIQCSPDHPWLKQHPGWFDWRPDGSIKYAENPPKKYQDIVNVDFYQPDAMPDLWIALRDAVLFWIDKGVTVFRVDNPHTKPLPFWEWMIADVRARHPEAIFLAEAFTRPTMMYRLAKIGFSQSYTYFTWRDHKHELTEYLTELTTQEPKEFYRPHFFVNTPDINPTFLQTSGRPGFRIRAVLAATLSGLFGVYSGFELCEAAPVPGKEEYLDSEKYEIRPRDWNAPGNIVEDITLLNNLRRAHPALQTHLNTRFLVAHDEALLYYAKPAPGGEDMILVMVSLDPHNAREADFEVPLWEFGLADHDSIAVEDLVSDERFTWRGKMQHIRIDPGNPYRIWRIAPGAHA